MYKCENCGHLFEDGEQAVWHENYGAEIGREMFDGCPVCKGGYEEVYQCKECGDWHSEDELYDGWCEKCLRKSINYDTFFEYCEANKDENYLDMFVMCYLLTCDEFPEYPSWEFHQLMIQVYQDRAEKAKENEILYGFIADCKQFIMEDDGHIGRENYAEWLNEREV